MTLKQKVKDLIKKGKKMDKKERVKLLDEVGRLRGEIFKQYRGKKMPQEIKELLRELGRIFPPSLYRLRKKK